MYKNDLFRLNNEEKKLYSCLFLLLFTLFFFFYYLRVYSGRAPINLDPHCWSPRKQSNRASESLVVYGLYGYFFFFFCTRVNMETKSGPATKLLLLIVCICGFSFIPSAGLRLISIVRGNAGCILECIYGVP